MGDINMIDKSGEPRPVEDYKRALVAVETSMVKDIMKLPPQLALEMTTIREGLVVLITVMERASKKD